MADQEIYKLKVVLEMEDKVQGTIAKMDGAANKLQERFKRTEDVAKRLGAARIIPTMEVNDQATARITGISQKLASIRNQEVMLSVEIDGAQEIDTISKDIDSIGDASIKVTRKTEGMTAATKTAGTALKNQGAAAKQAANGSDQAGQGASRAASLMDRLTSSVRGVATSCSQIAPAFRGMASSIAQSAQVAHQSMGQLKSHVGELKGQLMGLSMVAAGGFGIFKLAEGAINAGDAAYKMSSRMHMSAAEAGKLNRILTLGGADANSFTSTIMKLDRQMSMAGANGNNTTKAMEKFGVNLKDQDGKLLSVTGQLDALAKAYQRAADAGNEEEFMVETLGPRGQELIGVFREYTDLVQIAGQPTTIGIDPERAHAISNSMRALGMQVKQVGLVMSDAFMPIAEEVIPKVMDQFKALAGFFKEHKSEMQIGAQMATYAMEAMAVVKIAQTALTIAKTLVDVATLPIKMADRIANPGAKAATAIAEGAAGVVGGAEGASAAAKPLGMAGRALGVGRVLSKAAVPIGVALDAYDMYKANPEDRTQKGFEIAGHWGGALAGGKAGAVAGAAIGSVVPVIGTAVGATVGGIAGGIGGYFAGDKIGKMMGEWFTKINWSEIKTKITTGAASAISGVGQSITQAGSRIATGFEQIKSSTLAWGQELLSKIVMWGQELPGKIGTFFSQIPSKVAYSIGLTVGVISTLPGRVNTLFSQLWQQSTTWVSKMAADISNGFSQLCQQSSAWISKTVDDASNWFSQLPGRVSTWWQSTYQSTVQWASEMYSSSVQWVSQTITDIDQWFSSLPGRAQTAWSSMWQAVDTWCSNTYSSVVSWFSQLPAVIGGYFDDAIGMVTSKASQIWGDIKIGFTAGATEGGIPAHANGGIFDTQHIAHIADDGAEAVIPLSSGYRSRGIALWQQAGNMLGMTGNQTLNLTRGNNGVGESLGTSIGNVWQNISNINPMQQQAMPAMAGASSGSNGMQLNFGGVNITIDQGADEEQMAIQIGRKFVKQIRQAIENRG